MSASDSIIEGALISVSGRDIFVNFHQFFSFFFAIIAVFHKIV